MTKKDTTANAALKSKTVSKEKADAFEIVDHIIRLGWKEPFFSQFYRIITLVKSDAVPTAGVSVKDNKFTMYWNSYFMAGLTTEQVEGLLMHEVYHLVYKHCTEKARKPHTVHNYATDLAINSLICEQTIDGKYISATRLPEGGLIPSVPFKPLTADQIKNMGQQAADRYEKVSQKIASFPLNQTSDWYFEMLMEDPEIAEAIESQSATKGKSLEQALADGDVKIDENGNLVDKDGNPVTLVPGSGENGEMDNHDGWGNLSDEQSDQMSGEIQEALRKAIEKCNSTNSWGSIGASTQGELKSMISNEIPWQAVLKQFCGMTRRADRSNSIKRINRKYAGIHPGSVRDYKANIAVYLDQSGSVSDSDLEMFAAELDVLAKQVTFTLFNFDTSVDEASKRELTKGKKVTLNRTRCGGTDFSCVTKHLKSPNGKDFDGALILTDGYASDPGICRKKLGWVICPTGQLQFTKAPKDFLIKMKNEKK